MSNAYNVVVGHGEFGKPDGHLTEMTMGQVYDFGRNTLIPRTRGNAQLGLKEGQGSSAAGAWQIVGSTMAEHAPKVYGQGWRDTKFSPEVQDRLAESIYNQADKKNLHKVWTSLPEKDYTGMTFEQMRESIQKGESGGNGYYAGAPAVVGKPVQMAEAKAAPIQMAEAKAAPVVVIDAGSDGLAKYQAQQIEIAALRDELGARPEESFDIPAFKMPNMQAGLVGFKGVVIGKKTGKPIKSAFLG